MQIYNRLKLYNRYVQQQASAAVEEHLISTDSFQKIKEAHPDTLYTPNIFIRIALMALTTVAVLFSIALFGMVFWSSDNSIITGLIILAFICYGVLERFARRKHYYNAGIDNTLMVATLVLITSAFFIDDFSLDTRWWSAVMMVLCGWMCLRFTDAFMAVLCYVSFFVFLFSNFMAFGSTVRIATPILMMVCSAIVYLIFLRRREAKGFHSYHRCYYAITWAALLTFYLSGNYFIVNELSFLLLGGTLTTSKLMSGLFWFFTIAIPLFYIAFGVLNKDRSLIRTGLVLIGVSVFTVRIYYALFPSEISMFIWGMILIAGSYALIRYLHQPKKGFVFKQKAAGNIPVEHIESVITTERFGTTAPLGAGFEFGGGSGGGSGASGSY